MVIMGKRGNWGPFLILTLFLWGCTGVISPKTLSQSEEPPPSLFLIATNPDPFKGKVIILGGEILGLTKKGGKTYIDFREVPLYEDFHPVLGVPAGDRFQVISPIDLDDLLFYRGKVVTVAGEFVGIGGPPESEEPVPILLSREMYVWDQVGRSRFVDYGAILH
jgi:outer membrane lipoprotein